MVGDTQQQSNYISNKRGEGSHTHTITHTGRVQLLVVCYHAHTAETRPTTATSTCQSSNGAQPFLSSLVPSPAVDLTMGFIDMVMRRCLAGTNLSPKGPDKKLGYWRRGSADYTYTYSHEYFPINTYHLLCYWVCVQCIGLLPLASKWSRGRR